MGGNISFHEETLSETLEYISSERFLYFDEEN